MSFIENNASNATQLKSVSAPSQGVNQWHTELFINVVIKTQFKGIDIEYRPTGARFTTGLREAKPVLFDTLLERSADGSDKWKAMLKHDYKLVRGKEIIQKERESIMDELDPLLQNLLMAVNLMEEPDYTDYIKVVGNMYAVTKSGTEVRLEGLFNPSLDVKVDNQQKALERQTMLIAAMLDGADISIELESITLNSDKSEEAEEEY